MLERGAMRGRIDAARETRGDDEAFRPKLACELAGEFLSRRRTVAGADDGDDGNVGEIGAALDVEEGRGRIDMGERRRIARLAERDELRAEALGARELGLGLGFGAETDVVAASAAPRQHRQRGNCRLPRRRTR